MARKPDISECACFNIRKTARVIARAYDQALEPSGLKNTQFTALALIDRLAPLTISELAEIMEIERTTLTRNLRILARDGLVSIRKGADARSKRIGLTAEGKARVGAAMPLWERAQSGLLDRFGKRRWSSLQKELVAITSVA